MYYKEYLKELENINAEIGQLEYVLDNVSDLTYNKILFNPFSKNARWQRALWRKIEALNREIGALNYRFHGDESFPNPVDFMQVIHDDNLF
jgi:hypothetical protein